MSFQENKFPIALGTVTAVAVGGLVWWGMKSGSAYETAKEEYSSAASDIDRLTGKKPYPNDDNRQAKAKSVADYTVTVDELQKGFDKYRAAKLENIPVDAFTDALIESRAALVAKFEENGTELPAAQYLGLGKYTNEPAPKGITGLLNYELGANQEIFSLLADAKPTALNNIYRSPLPEEKGQKFDSKGKGYRVHTLELTFTGNEESVRQFLSGLDDSEKYYFAVRALRIKNERATAPNAKDARFEQATAPVAADDPFGGGFTFPDEDGEVVEEETVEEVEVAPEPEAPSDSGEILKQVLGSEKVQVFVCIDVLQFLAPKPLPKG